MYSQQQYDVLRRPIRYVKIKIDLLNANLITVDSLEGVALDGSITISATSTHRRMGNLKMIIHGKNNLLPAPDSKIWFNNHIRVWIGMEDYIKDEMVWFNLGIFAADKIDVNYSSTSLTIACELKDNMAFLDGTLGGRWSSNVQILSEGATIREAVRAVLGNAARVSLDPVSPFGVEATLPYTIEQPPNSTKYDLIKKILEVYKGYEFFYDENGYFILRKMIDHKYDPVLWDFTQDNMQIAIDYSRRFGFSDISNSIHIIGRQLDNGVLVRYSYRNRFARQFPMERNMISDAEIGDICHVYEDGRSYAWTGSYWSVLDFNVTPMFNIENIGEKIFSLTDTNIQTTSVAKLRAEYELWQKTNFAETVSFPCVPIYMLDANRKIKLLVPEVGIEGEYLISSITVPLSYSGTMNVEATKIYY